MRLTPAVGVLIGMQLILLSVAAMSPAAPPATAPSVDQIQQALDAGQYPEVIRQVSAAIQAGGKNLAGAERATLLALKGEAHLRLRQSPLAADAFADAAKEPGDELDIATYAATATLIRRSPGGQYQPKPAEPGQPRPQAIDIEASESRKQALAALFSEELRTVLARIESLKKRNSLPPVMEALKQVAELRRLELAATGSDTTCRQILAELTAHTNSLLSDAISTMSQQVQQIAQLANQTTTTTDTERGRSRTITRKRGLTSVEQKKLNDVIRTCRDIQRACDELSAAMQTAQAGGFDSSKSSAQQLATRAEQVLKDDYSPQYSDSDSGFVYPRSGGRGRSDRGADRRR